MTAAGNLLVLQGGGPTPVINATLFGVIDEALRHDRFGRIFGARFGIEGLLAGDLLDLTRLSPNDLQGLRTSPGASLGTTRFKPSDDDLGRIVEQLRDHDVRALVLIGGNGSLRGAQAIAEAVDAGGFDCCVVGVPKTVDNDVRGTDRCPGFGSAARYFAQAVRDLGMDVRALPQPVSIFETMGRSVGWLAGATVLGKLDEAHAPHLVYLPERPFEIDRFIGDVDRVVRRLGWAVAVVAEGMKNSSGQPVWESAATSQRDALDRALPGGVAAHLADVVTQRLKIRCRWEKPGLCARSSMLHVSQQDVTDAELVGRAGVRAALADEHGCAIALRPLAEATGEDGCVPVPLAECAGGERRVPAAWMDDSDTSVARPFVDYVRPIVGELVKYAVPLKDQLTRVGRERQIT